MIYFGNVYLLKQRKSGRLIILGAPQNVHNHRRTDASVDQYDTSARKNPRQIAAARQKALLKRAAAIGQAVSPSTSFCILPP
jgi:hypothetical protein